MFEDLALINLSKMDPLEFPIALSNAVEKDASKLSMINTSGIFLINFRFISPGRTNLGSDLDRCPDTIVLSLNFTSFYIIEAP